MRKVRRVLLVLAAFALAGTSSAIALPGVVSESVIGSSGTAPGQMNGPMDVAVDSSGIFVSDRYNDRVDVFNTASGAFVRSFGSSGSGPGQFNSLDGIAVGTGGNGGLYVVDVNNKRVQVFDALGNVYGSFGTAGQGTGEFYGLDDVAFDFSSRVVYTLESGMSRVQRWADGRPPTLLGTWPVGGVGATRGIGIAYGGTVYVSDDSGKVSWYSSSGNVGGSFGTNGTGPGQFRIPRGIAFTPGGNVLVADSLNDRIQEWTNTGQFVRSFGETSGLSEPQGIAVYSPGNSPNQYDVYVADFQNDRIVKYAFGLKSAPSGSLDVRIAGGTRKILRSPSSLVASIGCTIDCHATITARTRLATRQGRMRTISTWHAVRPLTGMRSYPLTFTVSSRGYRSLVSGLRRGGRATFTVTVVGKDVTGTRHSASHTWRIVLP